MADLDEIGKQPEKLKELSITKKGINIFFGEKEVAFFTEAGREVTEAILQESFLVYRINLEKTKVHPLYGEAKKKVWYPETQVFGRINVEAIDPSYQVSGGIVKKGMGKFTAHVYIDHLRELDLVEKIDGQIVITKIKMGDFIGYKNEFYQVTNDGFSQISNEFAWAGDRRFYITITAIEIDEDVFKAR